MSQPTYFVQECPTCGRRLQVRVEYLGRQVICQHCQGQFEAADPSATVAAHSPDQEIGPTESAVLRRANQLLESIEQRRAIAH